MDGVSNEESKRQNSMTLVAKRHLRFLRSRSARARPLVFSIELVTHPTSPPSPRNSDAKMYFDFRAHIS